MKKIGKILVDVDDVIVDNAFLDAINKFAGTNYAENDFSSYFMDEEVFDEKDLRNFRNYLLTYDIYENCRLKKDVKKVLSILSIVFDVYICSHCVVKGMESKSGILFEHKYNFLVREFPYLDVNKIIFTGSKNIFSDFDYQIDDRFDNLLGNTKKKLLFDSYHNRVISNLRLSQNSVVRVNGWLDILNIMHKETYKNNRDIWEQALSKF